MLALFTLLRCRLLPHLKEECFPVNDSADEERNREFGADGELTEVCVDDSL